MADLKMVEASEPNNKDALMMHSALSYLSGDYLTSWQYARQYERLSGIALYDILSTIYLELGDFAEARQQMELKKKVEEFSCGDIESYQRIFLCEGNFEKLEKLTDSVCALNKCDECGYWILRAK